MALRVARADERVGTESRRQSNGLGGKHNYWPQRPRSTSSSAPHRGPRRVPASQPRRSLPDPAGGGARARAPELSATRWLQLEPGGGCPAQAPRRARPRLGTPPSQFRRSRSWSRGTQRWGRPPCCTLTRRTRFRKLTCPLVRPGVRLFPQNSLQARASRPRARPRQEAAQRKACRGAGCGSAALGRAASRRAAGQ